MSGTSPRLTVVPDPTALAHAALEVLRSRAEAAIAARGRFLLALSGGSTPLPLYRLLGRCAAAFPWPKTHIFWGDERDVAVEHEASNYGAVKREMLDRLPAPPAGVHPILAGGGDAEAVARAYERELVDFFDLSPGQLPRFDLVLLGLGGDGHTASLFPGHPALDASERLVVAPFVERFAAHRITVTLPVLAAARAVLFLVDGEAKAEVLARVLEGGEAGDDLPARRVRPGDGELLWLVDAAAASRLAAAAPRPDSARE